MGQREDRATTEGDPETAPSSDQSMTAVVTELETVDPRDLASVVGVGPKECILELVEEHDGKLPQEQLVELLPWSAPTVSRLLSELETNQRIIRLHAGRGKVVFLTEEPVTP